MRCPFCSNEDTQVKDSRPTEDNTAIRRRRVCDACGSRFTTFERIQLRDLVVMKSNGQKENFDRDKMYRSLSLALRKRNVDNEKIEKIVNALMTLLGNPMRSWFVRNAGTNSSIVNCTNYRIEVIISLYE